MTPDFLTAADVVELHIDLIESFGGQHGVRDAGLLESALAQPSAMFGGQFLCADKFEMAAAYLYHIVKNHPFLDGNKRSGATAAAVFLRINGLRFEGTNAELVDITLGVAEGRIGKPEVAAFFRAKCVGVSGYD